MKPFLSLTFLLFVLVSCQRNKVEPTVSSCVFPGVQLTRTNNFIKDVPATVVAYTNPSTQVVSYQIMRGGSSAALGSCNLPTALAKDSLKITVSGYFLTFPGLEFMNLSPLPFEITDAKLRE